ncbi:PREDICTED: uncharacterized protein LOC108562780 isoform X2 [Nicrophorus vespilloides]|uniref:Uncharacterized protein LOC108562780 isoform X2 n=1 Tax=Nicrophorus vespilloides TaxID=110193 RepID=A0ABM1MQ51_NICVS|nr:PREDICTED: uncharacterized protein LOC108562780 isoform X2 [Nicrophorus vespilloides]
MYPVSFPINNYGMHGFYQHMVQHSFVGNEQIYPQMVQIDQPPLEDSNSEFVDTSKEFENMIYNEFYGPPGMRATQPKEKQNPLDRYFALKNLLVFTGDPASPASVKIKRKRAIQEEMDKVSEILRRGPPKDEFPPWSKSNKPNKIYEKEKKDRERQYSQKNKRPGFNIQLSTHVADNNRAVTSKKVYYAFPNSSHTHVVPNDTGRRVNTKNRQSMPKARYPK